MRPTGSCGRAVRIRQRPSVLFLAAIGLAAIFLECGCARRASHATTEARLPGAALAILTSSGGTAKMESDLANSVQVLIQRCMRARHLIYYPILQSAASPESGSVVVPEFPAYGSLAERRVHGYGLYSQAVHTISAGRIRGLRSDPAPSGAPDREDAYLASLPAAARARYTTAEVGPASDELSVTLPGGARAQVRGGGCRAEAVREIYGSMTGYIQALEGAPLLFDDLINTVEATPEFVAAVRDWSRCMAARGFRYGSPDDAYDDLADEYQAQGPTPALRRREIMVAIADLRCARQVSLLPITNALQNDAAGQLGKAAEEELRRIAQTDAWAVRRARIVTSDAGK